MNTSTQPEMPMADHASTDPWENGELGRSEEHARVAPKETNEQVDEALGLTAISIRLPKDLIDEFKLIAKIHGVGYQPLMRDALKRFARHELKRLVLEYQAEAERQKAAAEIEMEKLREAA